MPEEMQSNLISDDTIKLLKKFMILRDLETSELKTLLGQTESDYQKKIARVISYNPEEVVIRQGDFDSWVFWVLQGSFAVIKNKVVIAVFDKPGEIFGEMSILEADCRTASVVSVKAGICVSIDMSVLDTLSSETIKNKISNGFTHLKSERLNITTDKLIQEKQKMLLQQKEFLMERIKLTKKENELKTWEKNLTKREKRLEIEKKHLVK